MVSDNIVGAKLFRRDSIPSCDKPGISKEKCVKKKDQLQKTIVRDENKESIKTKKNHILVPEEEVLDTHTISVVKFSETPSNTSQELVEQTIKKEIDECEDYGPLLETTSITSEELLEQTVKKEIGESEGPLVLEKACQNIHSQK